MTTSQFSSPNFAQAVGSVPDEWRASCSDSLRAFRSPVSMVKLANEIVSTKRVPAYGVFLQPEAAASWRKMDNWHEKARYEGEAWKSLGLAEQFSSSSAIGVIGLGVGLGRGETELVEQIIKSGKRVCYAAVDTAPELLKEHVRILEARLASCIDAQMLHVTLFQQNMDSLPAIAKSWGESALDAFKSKVLIVITNFGNNLGNYPFREGAFVNLVRRAFQDHPLCLLLGLSVARNQSDYHDPSSYDILLGIIRSLVFRFRILRCCNGGTSSDEVDREIEFNQGGENDLLGDILPVRVEEYKTHDRIHGLVHSFRYSFTRALVAPCGKRLSPGDVISVLSVVKYSPESVGMFLEHKNFEVRYDPKQHLVVDLGNGQIREYALLAGFQMEKAR